MDGFGTMREKIDIKILILFILRRLPSAVDPQTLANLALADGTVGYFEYAECLSELLESGHVERTDSGFVITQAGDRNCEIVESSLPYTIRARINKSLSPVAEKMRRNAMVTADHEKTEDGAFHVRLSLSDGFGSIMNARLLCAGENQADSMEKTFRKDAEAIYNSLMDMLLHGVD